MSKTSRCLKSSIINSQLITINLIKKQNYHQETFSLTNLVSNLQVVKRQDFPLYTWILVDLPPGPTQKPANFWSKFKKSLDSGMQYAAGGIGNKVADAAIKFAAKNEEDAWESEDTIY